MAAQQLTALERANQIRSDMARYKKQLANREISITEAIETCDLPLSVHDLLMAAPSIGKTKAARIVQVANLPSDKLSFAKSRKAGREITKNERDRLLAVFKSRNIPTYRAEPQMLDAFQTATLRRKMQKAGCLPDQIEQVLAA